MNVIHELAKTKTVLLISHRLANVVKSDQIYFLKDGEIKESGKHDELMSRMVHTDIYMKARWLWKTMERGSGIMSEHTNTTKRRSAIQIMGSLIGLVKPLLHIMLAALSLEH